MKNSVFFILGGAAGIGAEVVRSVASSGAKVAICDIDAAAGERLAAETGGMFIHCNAASEESVGEAVARCVAELGKPTYAHLNSGVMTAPSDAPFTPFENASLEAYRRVMSVNVDGVFFGLRHLIPLMREAGGGITVTASRAGIVATPFDPIYAASKAAVLQLMRSVAAANAHTALRINAICPGTVDTAMLSDLVRGAGVALMPPSAIAEEVISLLIEGANGEVRAKIEGRDAFAVGDFNNEFDYIAPKES